MKAVSSTVTGCSRRETHHERRHRNAMVHMGRDQAAARHTAAALDDQVVARDLDLDAVDAQHRGGGSEPVGFLDAQFLQAAHARGRRRRKRRRRRGSRYSSIIEGARSGGTSTPLSAMARRADRRRPRRHRRAARSRRSAPISRSVVNSPVRSGLVITPSSTMSEPGTISAATIGKAAEDGSAGTATWRGGQLGLAFSAMRRPCAPSGSDHDLGAEMAQHALGVVAGRLLLDHGGVARRGQAGQQHRRFDLRGGDRRAVDDRDRIARAFSVSGSRPPSALSTTRAPICSSGSSMRPIGRVAQRGVAVERRRDRAAGDGAHHQAAAGAGIAEIERRRRAAAKPPTPTPWTRQAPSPGALDRGAERPHGVGGVEHVFAFEQARDPGLADRQGAEDQRPMRDRLVARHADAAAQGAGSARGCSGMFWCDEPESRSGAVRLLS